MRFDEKNLEHIKFEGRQNVLDRIEEKESAIKRFLEYEIEISIKSLAVAVLVIGIISTSFVDINVYEDYDIKVLEPLGGTYEAY